MRTKIIPIFLILIFSLSTLAVAAPVQAQTYALKVDTWWKSSFYFMADGRVVVQDDELVQTVIYPDYPGKPDAIRTYTLGNVVIQEFSFGSKGMVQINYTFLSLEPKVKISISSQNYKFNKFNLVVDASDASAKGKNVKVMKDKNNVDTAVKSGKVKFDWSDAIKSNMVPASSFDTTTKKHSLSWSVGETFVIDPTVSSDEGSAPSQLVAYSYNDATWGDGANGPLVVSSGTVTLSSPANYTYIYVASGAMLNMTSAIIVRANQNITVYGTLQIASDNVILYSPLIYVNGSGTISGDGLGRAGYNFTLVAYNLTCYGSIHSGGAGGAGGSPGYMDQYGAGQPGGSGGDGYSGGKLQLNFTYAYISGSVYVTGGGGGGGGGGGASNDGQTSANGASGGKGGNGGTIIIANSSAIQGSPQISAAGGGGGGGGGGGAHRFYWDYIYSPGGGASGAPNGKGGNGGSGGSIYYSGDGYITYGGSGGSGGSPGANGVAGSTGSGDNSGSGGTGGAGGTAGTAGTITYTTPSPSIPSAPTSGTQSTSYSYYWVTSAENTTYLYNFSYSFPSNVIKQLKVTFPKGMSILNITSPHSFPLVLQGWQYRKTHTITGSTAGAVTDYQVRITVWNLTGTDSDENVYLGSNVRQDFGDVRFTDANGNLLSYWIESVNSTCATFWVKVPSIPASPDIATIYMYYGNPSATTTSNGESTFLLFDDFLGTSLNTTKWSVVENQGTITVTNGYLDLYRPDQGKIQQIQSVQTFSGSVAIEYRAKILQSNFYYASLYYGTYTSASSIGYSLYEGYESALYTGAGYNPPRCGSTLLTDGDVITNPPVNTWFRERFIVPSGGYLSRVLNEQTTETSTSYIGVSSGYVGMYAQSSKSDQMEHQIDWIFVRKYTSPEPSHGSWGTEETDVSTVLQTSEYTVAEYNSTHWVITIPDATINSKGTSYQLYTTATCAIYDLKMGDDSTFPVYLPLNSPMNFKAILKDPYGNPIQQSATFMIMDSQNKILGTNTTTSDSSGIALASVTTPSSAGAYYIRANTTGNYAGLLYNTIKVTDIDHSTSFNDERTWIWDASTLSGYAYYTVDYTSLPGKVTINGTDVTLSGGQFSKAVQSSTVGNFSYVLTFNDTKYVTKTTTVYHIFDYPKVTPSFDSNGNVYFAVISTFDNSSLPFAYSVDSDKATLGSFQYGLKSFTWNVLTRNYGDKTFKITTDANSTIVVTSADPSLRKIIFNTTGPANVTVWVGSIGKPYQVKVDGAVVNFIWDDASKTLIVPITSTTVELDFPAPPEEGRGGGGIIWTPTVPSPSDTSTTPPASTVPPSVGASPEIVKFGLFAIVLAGVAALVAKEVQERAKLSYKFKAAFRPKKITKKDWDKARKKKWWG